MAERRIEIAIACPGLRVGAVVDIGSELARVTAVAGNHLTVQPLRLHERAWHYARCLWGWVLTKLGIF